MSVKSRVSFLDQSAIEALLTDSGFVTATKNDGVSIKIESKGKAPHSTSRVESQLLHVRMFRTFQCVNTRPAELRSELFKQFEMCKQLVLHCVGQAIVFRIEVRMKFHDPRH